LDSLAKISEGALIVNSSCAFDIVKAFAFKITNASNLDIPNASVLTSGMPVPLRTQTPLLFKVRFKLP